MISSNLFIVPITENFFLRVKSLLIHELKLSIFEFVLAIPGQFLESIQRRFAIYAYIISKDLPFIKIRIDPLIIHVI